MAIEYSIIVKDPNGTPIGAIDDFITLNYQKVVNQAGVANIIVPADHRIIADLEYDCQIEIWRKDDDANLDWYRDFDGLFMEDNYSTTADGVDYATLVCPGVLSLLDRAIVAYPNGENGRSSFPTGYGYIIESLVYYNCALILGGAGTPYDLAFHTDGRNTITYGTSYALSPSRLMNNDNAWRNRIYIETPPVAPTGTADGYNYAFYSVLDACLDIVGTAYIATMTKIDDSDWLVPSLSGASTANIWWTVTNPGQWRFDVYGAGGTAYDKTSDVVFATELGNMINPQLLRNRIGYPTQVLVGGEGAADSRLFNSSSNYSSEEEIREFFVSAPQVTTTTAAATQAAQHLARITKRNDIVFGVRQTPNSMYGRDYNIADRVTARYLDFNDTKRVEEVTVSVVNASSGLREAIQIRMEDV